MVRDESERIVHRFHGIRRLSVPSGWAKPRVVGEVLRIGVGVSDQLSVAMTVAMGVMMACVVVLMVMVPRGLWLSSTDAGVSLQLLDAAFVKRAGVGAGGLQACVG
jgi:hypothetical protein